MVRRLDRGDEPSRAELVALDEAAMSKRFTWLAMYGTAADPTLPVSALLRAERDRLAATGAPVAVRLAALERWLADRGLLDSASGLADRFVNPRVPWPAPARTGTATFNNARVHEDGGVK